MSEQRYSSDDVEDDKAKLLSSNDIAPDRLKAPLSQYRITRGSERRSNRNMSTRQRRQIVVRSCCLITTVMLIMWLMFGWSNRSDHATSTDAKDKTFIERPKAEVKQTEPVDDEKRRVKVDVYGEAYCPDTTRFWEEQLWPVWQSDLRNYITLTYTAYGKAKCTSEGGTISCRCQHGMRECNTNALSNCVQAKNDDPVVWMPILHCLQEEKTDLETAKKCLPESWNAQEMVDCAMGDEGRRLLMAAGERQSKLEKKLYRVPWVVIDDKYNVDAEYRLKKEICAKIVEYIDACRGA